MVTGGDGRLEQNRVLDSTPYDECSRFSVLGVDGFRTLILIVLYGASLKATKRFYGSFYNADS